MSTWTHNRTEVHKITVNQIGGNFLTYNESWRRIRKNDKACVFCRKPFDDGSNIHLAFTDKGNKIMCDKCLVLAIASGVPVNYRDKEEIKSEQT